MGKFIDIYIKPKGCYITILQFFQFGVEFSKYWVDDKNAMNNALNICVSIYKFGCHLHLVKTKENICHVEVVAKS